MKKQDAPLEELPTKLRHRVERSRSKIAELDLVLRGTVAAYYTTCGKPSCRCLQEPPDRHGPYFQWTTKVDGKTRTVRLRRDDVPLYRDAIKNGRRLDELISSWTAASMAALEHVKKQSRS